MKALGKETGDSYIPIWLNHAGEVLTKVEAEIKKLPNPPDGKGKRRMIELENVRAQVAHLRTYPLVKAAEAEGRIRVHGLYYDLESGRITRVP